MRGASATSATNKDPRDTGPRESPKKGPRESPRDQREDPRGQRDPRDQKEGAPRTDELDPHKSESYIQSQARKLQRALTDLKTQRLQLTQEIERQNLANARLQNSLSQIQLPPPEPVEHERLEAARNDQLRIIAGLQDVCDKYVAPPDEVEDTLPFFHAMAEMTAENKPLLVLASFTLVKFLIGHNLVASEMVQIEEVEKQVPDCDNLYDWYNIRLW